MVLGPRWGARPRRLDPGSQDAAGHGEPAGRHGRPAGHAPGRSGHGHCLYRHGPADRDDLVPPRRLQRRGRRADDDQRNRKRCCRRERRRAGWGVEVSTDGGSTWHPAQGRDSWTYTWTPGTTGTVTIEARAVDDSGNIGTPDQVTVNVIPHICPCSIWNDSFTLAGENDPNAVEVGVKFRSDQRPASSPACASTRPPATPAPTSATCGQRMEPSWPRRPSAERPHPAGSRSASTTRWRSMPIRPT